MIRRLTLRNWRNYEDITVDFRAGTTFVVASNGVGKTSLVEAARWALFGLSTPAGNSAIRAGESSAIAIVELELPDQRILSVERMLASRPRSTAPPPIVRLDGALVHPEELKDYLTSAYGTEPAFLAGLTMPAVDRNHDKPSALGLEEHLGQYYGIDSLKIAVDQLKALQKSNEARIKQTKDANLIDSQRLAQLQNDIELTARSTEEAAEAYEALQVRANKSRERELLQADVQKWQYEYAAWTEAVDSLTERVSAELGRPVGNRDLEEMLTELLVKLDQEIEAIRIQIAVNSAKEATLTANEERLDTAHDDCPVCRRPLDDVTLTFAHEANKREISAIKESTGELKTAETEQLAVRERVKAAQTELRMIQHPGQPLRTPPAEVGEPITTAQLATMTKAALEALVEARASHLQATQEFNKARAADNAMRELESLFKREASLRIAIETTESTLTELLDETILPLAGEVNQRWKALFPDRGELKTYSDGNITRTVNGHLLPYDSFSTGESMGATILLRLLAAQMATTANFCWFDEPLEHLDPDVRRKVASLLSRVTSGEGPIKQVVVTTYEEPLARHLKARDEQTVTLLDVRQAG